MNWTYTGLEIRRVLRSRRALFFSLLFPVLLFELIGPTYGKGELGGLRPITYVMVSMGTFGLMSTTFSMGGRIAFERSAGWNRQLRLTALTGWEYVASKVLVGFSLGIPSLTLVYVLGAAHGVHLSAARWLASGVSIVVAVIPLAVAGIWVGYLVDKAESAQQLIGLVYSALGFLGGIWIPLAVFPRWLQLTAEALPVAWIPIAGRKAVAGGWVGWQGALILLGWTAVFAALAGRAYVRDGNRV